MSATHPHLQGSPQLSLFAQRRLVHGFDSRVDSPWIHHRQVRHSTSFTPSCILMSPLLFHLRSLSCRHSLLIRRCHPLRCTSCRMETSGAYMPDTEVDKWLDPSLQASSPAACALSAPAFKCSDCFSTQLDHATAICYTGTQFPSGAQFDISTFCAGCPTGCGPFR